MPTFANLCGFEIPTDQSLQLPNEKPSKASEETTSLKGNHAIVSRDHRFIHYADGSEELYAADDTWNHQNLLAEQDSDEVAKVAAEHRKWLPDLSNPDVEDDNEVNTIDQETETK